jgi:ligand-binding sensor domain-containing protein
MTHCHELQQVLWVETPLGDGIAILHLDYGSQHNGTLLVMLEDGRLRYFDTNQVKACRNDTAGISVPRTRKVVAMSNCNILQLRGAMGVIVEERGEKVEVLFSGEGKSTVCSRNELLFL